MNHAEASKKLKVGDKVRLVEWKGYAPDEIDKSIDSTFDQSAASRLVGERANVLTVHIISKNGIRFNEISCSWPAQCCKKITKTSDSTYLVTLAGIFIYLIS